MTKAKKTTAKKTAAKNSKGKTAQVRKMLARPSGATREQVLKFTGWKAVSMAQVVGNSGKLKIDQSKIPFVYRV